MNMDAARQAFLEEVEELLHTMEDALFALESNPSDNESLNAVFRAMHTIKGTGGVFGYTPIVNFTHEIESVMEEVRSGREPMTDQLVSILFECRDHTGNLVEAIVSSDGEESLELDPALIEAGTTLVEKLAARNGGGSGTAASGSAKGASTQDPAAASASDDSDAPKYLPMASDAWIIALDFGPDALRNGMDPLSFLRYLSSLGNIVDVATIPIWPPNPSDIDPESCYLSFRISFRSEADKAAIADVFNFAEDDCDIRILPPETAQDKYLEMLHRLPDDQISRIGEMLVEIGALTQQELDRGLALQGIGAPTESEEETAAEKRPLGEILVEQGAVKPALMEQAVKTQEAARKRQDENRFIRVDAERLGHLINLVGELVTSSAAIRVMVERHGIEDMAEVVDGVDYLVEEIRDNALQLRMVPIGDSLSRFRRVVRDSSKDLGKEIDLVITGGETELDKTLIEKITDPLTHLIRNAIDHAIELPEERQRAGKPTAGTILCNAFHDSGHIVIEIKDDGAGLDAERIRAKAEAKGMVKPEDVLSHEETLRLIFEPGLSTKDTASNLSGRGVGMDVVRRNIEALRGSVELESERGKGTKITIILPLTLAIIDGFLVGAGREQYVIPLSQVSECVEVDPAATTNRNGEHYVNLRGEVLPFIRLTELFRCNADERKSTRESLVVVRFGHHKLGLVVDTLLGELQTVIKPLGNLFENLHGIAGATILGTGDIALILDVGELANIGQTHRRTAN
ncbi:chemotaxis protein CheA [Thiorhodovibrio frisius]|uniref:Chemotaxis protein CheA n=1 Tax=Thiorhodovibrio frisius TaxID=631362 RepID=H8YZS1_9GAMM|nr:chemotaxis protein CheA [Thiorhodovibrio frisius]EIC22198.1 chemotaxis protein histidine kinase-like protein [Thiorhodovibrio frisius]WPL24492.1 Chemotaxis protein CheA [Thiorhodovibrio frisius]